VFATRTGRHTNEGMRYRLPTKRDQATATDQPPWLLDRPVNLTAIPLRALGWIVVTLLTVSLSLVGRGNWPLSPGESEIARDAWALMIGNDLTSAANAHPAIVQATGLMFFLFGDTDVVGRFAPLAFGLAVIGALYWLRTWFGEVPALSIAVVFALSPTMTLSMLRIDGAGLLVLSSLVLFVLTISLPLQASPLRAVVFGFVAGVGFTAHPLGWIFLPVTILCGMLLIREFRMGGQVTTVLVSTMATILLVSSWFLSRPGAVAEFFSESFSVLWVDHLQGMSSAWQATIVVLLIDEPLIIVLALTGLAITFLRPVWAQQGNEAVFISCLAWAIPVFTLGLLLDGKGPALYAITFLPLIVLAGLGLSMLIGAAMDMGWQRGRPFLWGLILFGFSVAVIRFADSIAVGPDADLVGWLVSVIAVGLLILIPLGLILIRLSAGTGWLYVPVALLLLVVILGAGSFRTSVMLTDTSQHRPGELHRAGNSSPGVASFSQRLRTYSRDVTTYEQDVRDPVGGRGLIIAVDRDVADPFAWYFRDFPDLIIVDQPDNVPADAAVDIVITPSEARPEWESALGQHQFRDLPGRYMNADEIPESTLNGLIVSAVNPIDFRNIVRYYVYRTHPALLERESFTVGLRDDHAYVLWGSEP
jgi:hypothetical protein